MSTPSGEPQWLSEDEQQAWRAYLRGSRLIEEALDRDLQSHGVQLTEYEILSMLSESPRRRLRMSSLADLVVQSRSRLTHTATRLEKRGWVVRESCLDDKRGVELVLTDRGLAGRPGHGAGARRQRAQHRSSTRCRRRCSRPSARRWT